MQFDSLDDFRWGWTFRHKELVIPPSVLSSIQPLNAASANQYWRTHISKEATHASHFLSDDWPSRNGVWQPAEDWQTLWESDDDSLPEMLAQHCAWEDNLTVFYCYDHSHIVQTQWRTFKAHWKNFLFVDEGTFLVGKKRQQVVRFASDGSYQLGLKPKN
jgi:hypothetical protein